MAYKKILVAFGPKEEDRKKVLDKASCLAIDMKAEMFLIYVEEDQFYGAAYGGAVIVDDTLHDQAKKVMEEAGKRVNVDEKHQLLERGSIRSAVLDEASRLKVDLVIMGCHHLTGLQKLFGERIDGIISESTCDVLAVQLDLKDEK